MTKRPRKVVKSSRDSYLQKRYGITEKEYDDRLVQQNFGCLVCGCGPGVSRLHVDHDHKIERWKIISKKVGNLWVSRPLDGEGRLDFEEVDRLKQVSRLKVKARLLRLSVRAILCWQHNAGIAKFRDNPEHLFKASEFLKNYYLYLDGKKEEHF